MVNKRFILFLTSVFLGSIILVVSLQYSSDSNINSLIKGNQELLREFQIKTEVQSLIVNLTFISTEERKIIDKNIRNEAKLIDDRIQTVNGQVAHLKSIAVNPDTRKKLDELETAINGMLAHYKTTLNEFYNNPKARPDDLLAYSKADTLANEILSISNYLTSSKDDYLVSLIEKADDNARRAKQFGLLLALTAILASIYTFGYIFNKVRKQTVLIERLNESEKKVRDAATIKENFMANMSHEIRTPMNAILGFTNLLQKEPLSSKAREFLDSIQKSSENLLTIINDVLDFSKIEAGMMRIESSPFSLRGLLHSVETMFLARAKSKHLQLSVEVEDQIPDVLMGDAVRLTQVLVNIVNNAIKFTNQGSIHIKVNGKIHEPEKIELIFSVKDTGIGIPADKLDTIFERFHQAYEDTTRKYGGTGLGLSIVKQLVELQNGIIRVYSVEDRGTEFVFTIPYQIAKDVEVAKKLEFSGNDETRINKINAGILVVEDNEMNQNLMRHLLKDWKLEFDIVTNGKEAIRALQKKKYYMVLMDIQMPEMDGYTATQFIRNELKSDVPIIAMTAHAMAGEREKCLSYGMNEYISKPIRETELFKILNGFLKNGDGRRPEHATNGHANMGNFKYINLDYLHELSGGDTVFEKTMVRQFLHQVPEEISELKKEFKKAHYKQAASIAHNMKTSVSFLGLLDKTSDMLDYIENNSEIHKESVYVNEKIAALNDICQKSIGEAEEYLRSLR